MSALALRVRRHRRPLAAATAVGGGTLAVAGVGAALAAVAAFGGFYLLERARNRRGELTG